MAPSANLSTRAQRHLDAAKPAGSLYSIKGKLYDKQHNPEGTINLATAENSLMSTELIDYMQSHFAITPMHLKYRYSLVNSYAKTTVEALPQYFNAYFQPRQEVLPEHVVTGHGLGSLLAQVVWGLCDEGQGVLLATPYYSDYTRDILYPARAKVITAHVPPEIDPLSVESLQSLRSTIERSNSEGTTIRMLILCNPHNPLATAYPKETIIQYALIAQEFNLHLIVDEVYALQTFPSCFVPHPPPFISILSYDLQSLGVDSSRVHVLAGPTKDFGASGMKVGALISQHNKSILNFIRNSITANPISSASDALFTAILEDQGFCDWFLTENRERLSRAFERVGNWCKFHEIQFVPASAGVFFVVDFAPLLDRISEKDSKTEDKVRVGVEAMLDAGVFIRPNDICEDPIQTRFRMTFALPEDTMKIALQRLEKAFRLPTWDGRY